MDKATQENSVIFSTAEKLLYANGIKETTVQNVCELAEVSMATFHSNFRDENELIMQIEKQRYTNGRLLFREIMDTNATFKTKISELLLLQLEELGRISDDYLNQVVLDDTDDFNEILSIFSHENIADLHQDILKAQLTGEVSPTVNANMVIYLLGGLRKKLKDPFLNALYVSKKDLIMDISSLYFQGILNE